MVMYSIAYLLLYLLYRNISFICSQLSYVISLISYISYTSHYVLNPSLMDPPLLHLLFCPSYILVPILYILLYAYLLYISPILQEQGVSYSQKIFDAEFILLMRLYVGKTSCISPLYLSYIFTVYTLTDNVFHSKLLLVCHCRNGDVAIFIFICIAGPILFQLSIPRCAGQE